MRRPDPTARRVLRAFAEAGSRTRVHTGLRWVTCPFDQVEALVPTAGRILDLGCGHGHFAMYLALRQPGREVVGVDIDEDKLAIGRRVVSRAGLGGRVDLVPIDPDWYPTPGSFDAVVATDVLYLMGHESAAAMLGSVGDAIRPGGRAVIKEIGSTPRWKHRVNDVQELLATRVLRLTAGDDLAVLAEEEIEAPLLAAGLTVTRHPMDAGYPHAHLTIVGERGT